MRVRTAAPIVALAALLLAAPVSAAEQGVTVEDYAFSSATITVSQGTTVRWMNTGIHEHTSSATGGLALWSIDLQPGTDGSRVFAQAGTFAYHCQIHASMKGTVKVPITVSPSSGGTGTTFLVRVGSTSAPSGYVYVIQRSAPGGSFRTWKTTTASSVAFTSSHKGTWRFRSELKRSSSGATSGFSPSASVSIG